MEQNNALARKFNAASLLRFALPNIAMMMLLSMYTIVDGMFISRFAGTTALSAINMSYPLNCPQMATGIMLGTGGSAIIARRQERTHRRGAPQLHHADCGCVGHRPDFHRVWQSVSEPYPASAWHE